MQYFNGPLTGVVESVLGSTEVLEFTKTSPTPPGITHKWTNVRAFVDKISEARIWASFHYRFSNPRRPGDGLQDRPPGGTDDHATDKPACNCGSLMATNESTIW